ncbi:hypothetical protein HYV50_00355 [Candidatus Pacearchaeota archaeon]|nr:hypothetical protein [Candidatus Pacearchaeota archaeon]
MEIEKGEIEHIKKLLEEIKTALLNKDMLKLKELSDHTVHSSCSYQDSGSITISVIFYTLSKLIERQDYKKIKGWNNLVEKLNSLIDLAIKSLKNNNFKKYEKNILKAGKTLTDYSINLKPYIEDVIKKASINKGSKIYEHGISLEQTAKLFGITQWELSDYIGQKNLAEIKQNETIDVKKRAKFALEFFET